MAYENQYQMFFEDQWNSLKFFGRYLDDVIALTTDPNFNWKSMEESIYQKQIILEDNSHEDHRTGIFLDVLVEVENSNEISYQLYRKPGNAYQYIHEKSFIAHHIKKNFIQHEVLRIQKRCKKHYDFVRHLKHFKAQLTKRGYSKNFINRITKKTAMEKFKEKKNTENPFTLIGKSWLVIPYNPYLTAEQKEEYVIINSNHKKLKHILRK